MAISYTLFTEVGHGTLANATAEVATAVGVFSADVPPAVLTSDGVTTESGMWIKVSAVEPGPNHPTGDFGLAPAARVTFRLYTSGGIAGQQDEMVRMLGGLLDRLAGDALLDYQFEVVWLLRQGGKLTVSDREDIWPPRRLALLPQPYTRGPLGYRD